jgi:LysM repeat protein
MNLRFDDNQPQAANQLGQSALRLNLANQGEVNRTLGNATGGLHTVQHGENLSLIAERYGLSAAELAAANDFGAAALLMPGQSIRTPQIEALTATVRDLPAQY